MTNSIIMPNSDGSLFTYIPKQAKPITISTQPFTSRIAYAAAHVVVDPFADVGLHDKPKIDWEATLSYRRYLWSLGLSVAEAMDTAQRGMGMDWETTKELIERSLNEAKSVGGNIACGAGTDHLHLGTNLQLSDVENAYLEQCQFIEDLGGRVILMASRALAACAKGPEDYEYIYDRILSQVRKPVILHWLGEMFDPALRGYWGHVDQDAAMEVCLHIIAKHSKKVHGIKISLLNAEAEIKMRRRLPEGVHMFTGDDFNYQSLILGDEYGHSEALLGIFDAIAPAAAAALQALDHGDITRYCEILEPTIPLSRLIFKVPTYYYKTGIVFMAYLNGHQSHFRMVGGFESARSIVHLSEIFRLADEAGLLLDTELAASRMKLVLALAGVV